MFTLELGDIGSNEKRVVKITVEFKTDAGGKTYTNLAAATGDNGSASGRSPEIEVVSSGSSGTPVLTDIHYQLFNGYGDGLWRPNDRVSLQEACTVVYRLIANGGNMAAARHDYRSKIPVRYSGGSKVFCFHRRSACIRV